MFSTLQHTRLDRGWRFRADGQAAWAQVRLPHTVRELPLQYFDESDYQIVSFYERNLSLEPAAEKRYFLQFDGVMTAFTLTVNGQEAGAGKGGYLPHRIEITAFLHGGENLLSVRVDSTERPDIPPFGNLLDYLTYGGIYRDVWLYTEERCFLSDFILDYSVSCLSAHSGNVLCTPRAELDNAGPACTGVLTWQLGEHRFAQQITAVPGRQSYPLDPAELAQLALWNTDAPALHEVSVSFCPAGGAPTRARMVTGFRRLELSPDELRINGVRTKLRGLNRHQSFPYVGYAMPRRVQEEDARILKTELGLNTVRSSHYPPSPYFLDACDRLGLLVLEEAPGWQFVSDRADWRQQFLSDVAGMVRRDRHHPSVLTYGVRVNESRDDDTLYAETNALARSLDPSRPTSGVRCIENSRMLEDLYTMNDFIHEGGENILRTRRRCTGLEQPVPYLVTEFCGHTYPTKRFDQEERLIEHALRHGRIQSLAAQKDEYLGAIGWCAFDYHTHYDFGSGDRLCYHGVMDAFRLPKFAAAVYKSQRPLCEGPVLEPLTYWARGERDRAALSPLHVFTNCKTLEIRLGNGVSHTLTRNFLNTDLQMQYLDNPPFVVNLANGEWGDHLSELELVGYEGDEPVIRKRFVPNPRYTALTLQADSAVLLTAEPDAVRIVVRALDQVGNPLPFLSECFSLGCGPGAEVIGPAQLCCCGGVSAFWVRPTPDAAPGDVRVFARSTAVFSAELTLKLI